jgi:lipoprotein-releasing system permease protein
MFELSIALKYLIPRRRHLSVTLIAIMSVGVISLVVWLLLVFLSVTDGMEKTWLKKLTDLNAPVRITPTPAYFTSYYYKIDTLSSASQFSYKTLAEKRIAPVSDPYDPEEDPELPSYFPIANKDPNGALLDPVKGLESILLQMQKQKKNFVFQDYEMSGATLKLQLLRNKGVDPFTSGQESLNFLTQVSYLATPPSSDAALDSLLLSPSLQDIQHLFFLAGYRLDGVLSDTKLEAHLSQEKFQENAQKLFDWVTITSFTTIPSHFYLPASMLPQKPLCVHGFFHGNTPIKLKIPLAGDKIPQDSEWKVGKLQKTSEGILLSFPGIPSFTVSDDRFLLDGPLTLEVKEKKEANTPPKKIQDLRFSVLSTLQNQKIEGILPWKHLLIHSFTLNRTSQPIWKEQDPKAVGILLPKGFHDNGVLIGDLGFLAYTSSTTSAAQELRSPIFVAGFYDPGLLSVGNRCLLVPRTITQAINSAGSSFSFDKIELNGFQVWIESPMQATEIKKEIEERLKRAGIDSYWKISTYKDYDFAKDLLQQFQSDKYLFSLVGIIILLVACCNILSFLILLVSDKKQEIAILQTMGASKKSVAIIFSTCGIFVGMAGSILGVFAAVVTLSNIDTLVHILSNLQGQEAFHQTFYGANLPSALSSQAALFVAIATPILSALAGLIPAMKACKINPSSVLRSES